MNLVYHSSLTYSQQLQHPVLEITKIDNMSQNYDDSEELWAVADLCLIPMGLADPSVGPQIAEVCLRFHDILFSEAGKLTVPFHNS
jgi:hypothetical protein